MAVTERLRARALQVLAKDESEPVPSPCQSICSMDAKDGLCLGCLRTLQEIAQWSQASQVQRVKFGSRFSHVAVAIDGLFAPLVTPSG